MKNKTLILLPVFLFCFSLLHSQVNNSKYLNFRIGPTSLYADIGGDYHLTGQTDIFRLSGFTPGIGYYFTIGSRWTFGAITQYSFLEDHDSYSIDNWWGPGLDISGYYYRSQLFELGFHAEYRFLSLFKDGEIPVDFHLGCLPEYVFSTGNVYYNENDEELLTDDYGYSQETVHSMIICPTLRMSVQFQKIQVGLCFEAGFSFTDFLDHYTYKFSKHNDSLGKVLLSVSYKLN